ncbi:MAG: HPr family phosphocarrier protein [Lachnospiraceae bacterium]|nr:HPr family phosphocarrier protein [Lachnospiraceae bacterium]
MKKQEVTVNVSGTDDTRPIAMLVQTANRYDSSVYIDVQSKHVNAKSIMGMMSLALKNGEEVTIVTDGADEEEALKGVGEFLTSAT